VGYFPSKQAPQNSFIFSHAFKNGKVDLDMKNPYCSGSKKTLEDYLKLFCRLLEINPEGLNYLLDMVLI